MIGCPFSVSSILYLTHHFYISKIRAKTAKTAHFGRFFEDCQEILISQVLYYAHGYKIRKR